MDISFLSTQNCFVAKFYLIELINNIHFWFCYWQLDLGSKLSVVPYHVLPWSCVLSTIQIMVKAIDSIFIEALLYIQLLCHEY